VRFTLGGVVPHIIIQSPHPRVGEFESRLAKILLQQYLPQADIHLDAVFLRQCSLIRCHVPSARIEAIPPFKRVSSSPRLPLGTATASGSSSNTLIEGFSHFVTSMAAPIASGWSGCRVGLTPTGKRRLCTAHANIGSRRPYSISSSATCWRSNGTSRPNDLAVLRLMIRSNFVGACTGRSPGFSPLRMRSIYPAAGKTPSS
jgi:hypothetical protein